MFTPQFTITHQMLHNVAVIENAKGVIETVPFTQALGKNLKEEALLKMIHSGIVLDGGSLTLGQIKLLWQGISHLGLNLDAQILMTQVGINAPQAEVQSVINYGKLFDYFESVKEQPLTFPSYKESELRQIETLLFDKILTVDQLKNYRQMKISVKDINSENILFHSPQPVEIPYQLQSLFDWLNSSESDKIHPVLVAGIAYVELFRIYPFLDGNRRLSQTLTSLILLRKNYDCNGFLAWEEFLAKNPDEYSTYLKTIESNEGNFTQWLEYFTLGFCQEVEKIKQSVLSFSLESNLVNDSGQQISLSSRQMALMAFLKEHSKMYMKDAASLLPEVSEDTLLRDLKALMKQDLIDKIGKTKGVYYTVKGK